MREDWESDKTSKPHDSVNNHPTVNVHECALFRTIAVLSTPVNPVGSLLTTKNYKNTNLVGCQSRSSQRRGIQSHGRERQEPRDENQQQRSCTRQKSQPGLCDLHAGCTRTEEWTCFFNIQVPSSRACVFQQRLQVCSLMTANHWKKSLQSVLLCTKHDNKTSWHLAKANTLVPVGRLYLY